MELKDKLVCLLLFALSMLICEVIYEGGVHGLKVVVKVKTLGV